MDFELHKRSKGKRSSRFFASANQIWCWCRSCYSWCWSLDCWSSAWNVYRYACSTWTNPISEANDPRGDQSPHHPYTWNHYDHTARQVRRDHTTGDDRASAAAALGEDTAVRAGCALDRIFGIIRNDWKNNPRREIRAREYLLMSDSRIRFCRRISSCIWIPVKSREVTAGDF